MSRLLAGAIALTAVLCFAACGPEDDIDDGPVVDDRTEAPPDTPWMPEDDNGNGGPPSGGIPNPCDRAMCWDLDRRSWVADPPPDYVIVSVEEVADPVAERSVGPVSGPPPTRLRINIRAAAR